MNRFGVIGFPLEHSFSPDIHNTALETLRLQGEYSKIEIQPDTFSRKILVLKNQPEWLGFNVTIPFVGFGYISN